MLAASLGEIPLVFAVDEALEDRDELCGLDRVAAGGGAKHRRVPTERERLRRVAQSALHVERVRITPRTSREDRRPWLLVGENRLIQPSLTDSYYLIGKLR